MIFPHKGCDLLTCDTVSVQGMSLPAMLNISSLVLRVPTDPSWQIFCNRVTRLWVETSEERLILFSSVLLSIYTGNAPKKNLAEIQIRRGAVWAVVSEIFACWRAKLPACHRSGLLCSIMCLRTLK